MIQTEAIFKQFTFGADRLSGLSFLRKVAFVFIGLRGIALFALFTVFTSLFLAFFKIILDEANVFVYLVLGFIHLVLILILYANFSKQIPAVIQQLFPTNSISVITFRSYTFTIIISILYSAWKFADWVFVDANFHEQAFTFIGRWVICFGSIIVLALLQYVLNKPVNSYKEAYFEQIGKWLINQIDHQVRWNEPQKWPSLESKLNRETTQELEFHQGINLDDMKRIFPDKIELFHSFKTSQSLSFFRTEKRTLDYAFATVQTKEVKKSSGKVDIVYSTLLNGSVLKMPISDKNITLQAESSLISNPLVEKNSTTKTIELNEQALILTGDINSPLSNSIAECVAKIQENWKSDVNISIKEGWIYLLIKETSIFQDLALSATIYSDSHIKKPLETLRIFQDLVV